MVTSNVLKAPLQVIDGEVCVGGPTRTRTWDQRIMSPLL